MDVRLSPEQQALRDTVGKLGLRHGVSSVAALDDADRHSAAAEAVDGTGLLQLRGDAGQGSPLASGVDTALVSEELARTLVDAAFVGPTLAVELRRQAGAPPADDPASETVVLVPDLSALALAAPDGTVDGVAIDAGRARFALVAMATLDAGPVPDRVAVARVPLGDLRPCVDLTSVLRSPSGPAAVAGGKRLLEAGDLARWTALGLALASAELVGAAEGALALARDYATVRRQYGKAIGSFQAVAHLLADAHVAVEGSRSVALHAAWASDALDPPEALAAAAVAKAYCARAAVSVCETAIQVHGGIGNTWDCLAHVYLRRALLSGEILGGIGPSLHRVLAHHGILADRVEPGVDASDPEGAGHALR